MEEKISLGSVVKSKQGRDKGKYFMVYSYDGCQYVNLVDGVYRKQQAPKRKKIKHIDLTGTILEGLAEKLQGGIHVFDPKGSERGGLFQQGRGDAKGGPTCPRVM